MKAVLPWLLMLAALAGLGAVYLSNSRLSAEVDHLKAENQELKKTATAAEESKATQTAAGEEVAKLRKDNEDLLKLRNEVRQLRQDKQQLSAQVQTAQNQAQSAQAQAQTAQAQSAQALAEAQRSKVAQAGQPALTPEQQQAMQQRYGLNLPPEQVCINNLRMLDGAKQQWALENQKQASTSVTVADILHYLRGGVPVCPSGGAYSLNTVGTPPTCSITGHVLPK
jgi:chromosome segregation ATPase